MAPNAATAIWVSVADAEQHQEHNNIADAGVERWKKSMTNSSER